MYIQNQVSPKMDPWGTAWWIFRESDTKFSHFTGCMFANKWKQFEDSTMQEIHVIYMNAWARCIEAFEQSCLLYIALMTSSRPFRVVAIYPWTSDQDVVWVNKVICQNSAQRAPPETVWREKKHQWMEEGFLVERVHGWSIKNQC